MMMSDTDRITEVTNPQSVSVVNGTAFGSIVFPSTVRAKRNGFWQDLVVTFEQGSYDSATNGSYVLNGKLNTFGNAVTITVWVLPSPTQWFDCIQNELFSHTIDNIDRIVTSGSAKVGATFAQGSASLTNRPSWNGDGIYFNTQGALLWGSTSSHNTFHQDTSWSVYVVWYQLPVGNTHYGPIYCSNATASASTGIALLVDSRIAQSNTYALQALVTKGVSGQVPINVTSADNVVIPNAWNWAKLKFNATDFTLYCNGSSVGTQTPSIAFATGNASNALMVGNLNTIGSSTGINAYLKHIYMEDSFVSGATETVLDNWATAMCAEGVPLEDVNVYLMAGQSNMAGRGLNVEIASPLSSTVGAKIAVVKPTVPTQTDGTGSVDSQSYFEELELGLNQTFENVGTQHGMEMRFGFAMNNYIKNAFLIKMGVGGTPLVSTGTYNDWNVSTSQVYRHFKNLNLSVLPEIQHVFRKNPIIRGFIWMQGETDAIITGAGSVYKSNFYTMINTLIDDIEAFGITISKMRIYIFRISDVGGFAYDVTEFPLIQTAQEEIGDNYLTDNPSYSSKVLGSTWRTTDDIDFEDAQHYSAAGQDVLGQALFAYFKQYIRE